MFAAQQAPTLAFNDVVDINSLSAIEEKINGIINLLKCGRKVVGNAIGDSDLKEDFQQFTLQVDKLIKYELPLCHAVGNIKDKLKCVNSNTKLFFLISNRLN